MVFFTTPELLEIGNIPMTSLNEKPNRARSPQILPARGGPLSNWIFANTSAWSVSPAPTTPSRFTRPIAGARHLYLARKIVLAMGYYDVPNMLGVPGEELDKVLHYYKEPHPYYGQDVAVIGGQNSAAIAALELHWTGARVTLIHREGAISSHVKYWIRPNLENRIKSGEIRAFFHSRVVEILPDSIRVATPDGEKTLSNDFVFAMIGYRPDLDFLSATGISLDSATQKPRTDPATLESECPGVYLAGVIVAGMHTNEIFIENGRFHGRQIAESIASRL